MSKVGESARQPLIYGFGYHELLSTTTSLIILFYPQYQGYDKPTNLERNNNNPIIGIDGVHLTPTEMTSRLENGRAEPDGVPDASAARFLLYKRNGIGII